MRPPIPFSKKKNDHKYKIDEGKEKPLDDESMNMSEIIKWNKDAIKCNSCQNYKWPDPSAGSAEFKWYRCEEEAGGFQGIYNMVTSKKALG